MTSKVMWDKTVDILRLATPVFIGILAYLFIGFQSTLQRNTDAINEFKTDLAVMAEKSRALDMGMATIVIRVDSNTKDVSELKARLLLVESKVNK